MKEDGLTLQNVENGDSENMGIFTKKPTQFDEQQNKTLQTLVNNQNILIKNNAWFISEIQKLQSENQKQDDFDKQVIAHVNSQDTTINNHQHLDLAKAINDLQKAVATLQNASHTHQTTTE